MNNTQSNILFESDLSKWLFDGLHALSHSTHSYTLSKYALHPLEINPDDYAHVEICRRFRELYPKRLPELREAAGDAAKSWTPEYSVTLIEVLLGICSELLCQNIEQIALHLSRNVIRNRLSLPDRTTVYSSTLDAISAHPDLQVDGSKFRTACKIINDPEYGASSSSVSRFISSAISIQPTSWIAVLNHFRKKLEPPRESWVTPYSKIFFDLVEDLQDNEIEDIFKLSGNYTLREEDSWIVEWLFRAVRVNESDLSPLVFDSSPDNLIIRKGNSEKSYYIDRNSISAHLYSTLHKVNSELGNTQKSEILPHNDDWAQAINNRIERARGEK